MMTRETVTKSAEPRVERSPMQARKQGGKSYGSVIEALEQRDPAHAAIVREYVRALRGECAATRVELKEAHKEIAYLEGRLDALEGTDE